MEALLPPFIFIRMTNRHNTIEDKCIWKDYSKEVVGIISLNRMNRCYYQCNGYDGLCETYLRVGDYTEELKIVKRVMR